MGKLAEWNLGWVFNSISDSMYEIHLPCILSRRALIKGKAKYGWPPCNNYSRSAALDIANICYFFTKHVTNEEVNYYTEPSSPFVSISWFHHSQPNFKYKIKPKPISVLSRYHPPSFVIWKFLIQNLQKGVILRTQAWLISMEQHAFKNLNISLNTNIYFYLETSVGQSSNVYINFIHFFHTSVNYTSVAA